MRRSWTEEQLTEAVRQSHSFCEAIRKLGLRPVGGNYESIKKNIARMNLDTSHFNNDDMIAPLRKRHARVAISDDEAFRKNGTWIGSRLRKRVMKLGFMPYVCALCGNPGTHCGKPLTLHLDHENGNHRDCRKENLRWLCPNCHTQTPTYARTTVQPEASV